MSKILRAFYRFFIKNRFIRWIWMLALVLWGVRVVTERGLAWKKAPLSKTVMSIPASTISTFTIRRNEDDETTFTLADTVWLAVKNNVTLRLPADSIQNYLDVFQKMEGIGLNILNTAELDRIKSKHNFDVFITQKNNTNHSFSVYYTDRDSISNDILTYIKLPNENALHGVKGDLNTLFGKNFDDYRNKTLCQFNKDSILYLTIKSPVDSFSFVRNATNWISRNRQYRVMQDEFRQYITSLQLLRGVKCECAS